MYFIWFQFHHSVNWSFVHGVWGCDWFCRLWWSIPLLLGKWLKAYILRHFDLFGCTVPHLIDFYWIIYSIPFSLHRSERMRTLKKMTRISKQDVLLNHPVFPPHQVIYLPINRVFPPHQVMNHPRDQVSVLTRRSLLNRRRVRLRIQRRLLSHQLLHLSVPDLQMNLRTRPLSHSFRLSHHLL